MFVACGIWCLADVSSVNKVDMSMFVALWAYQCLADVGNSVMQIVGADVLPLLEHQYHLHWSTNIPYQP